MGDRAREQAELDAALRQMEVAAANFGARLARMAGVRTEYMARTAEMSREIRAAVQRGELSPRRGAELANEMRNQILEMARARDFDLGKSLARQLKQKGLTLEEVIPSAMKDLKLAGRDFRTLTDAEQSAVYVRVIEKAGSSRPSVNAQVGRLRWAGRGLFIASLAIAAYNIGTAEDPWWQTGREGSNLAGGLAGGFAGGAAMGAAGGVWAGPVGVAVGVLVGGVLGALLADRAYVEAAGTADASVRAFVGRFTNFWTGTDETGMARAMVRELGGNAAMAVRALRSLEADYSTDADDVALELVRLAKTDGAAMRMLRGSAELRGVMAGLLEGGWVTGEEREAARWLRGL
jgi:hypothetical protein